MFFLFFYIYIKHSFSEEPAQPSLAQCCTHSEGQSVAASSAQSACLQTAVLQISPDVLNSHEMSTTALVSVGKREGKKRESVVAAVFKKQAT